MSDIQPRRDGAPEIHDAGFEPEAPTTPPGPTIEIEDEPRKRTVAEIEADNARARAELSRTVDELADRVDPRAHVAAAKDRASEAASEVAEVAKAKAAVAQDAAAGFVDDVKKRDPKALAIAAGAAAALVAIVLISVRKK